MCPLHRLIRRELFFVYSENSEQQLFWCRSDVNLLSWSHLLYINVVGTQLCLVTTVLGTQLNLLTIYLSCHLSQFGYYIQFMALTIYISWHLTQFSDHLQSRQSCQFGDHIQFLELNSFGWLFTFLGNLLPHFLKKNSLNTLLVAIMYLWLCCILCIWS